jgi:hypothetical protein
MQNVGTGLENVATAFNEQQKQQDALELLKADVSHKQALNDLSRSFDNDSDYSTQQTRYRQQADQITAQAAQGISNPAAREQWQLRAGLQNQQQSFAVGRTADAMVKQQNVVKLEDTLDGYRDQFLDPKADDETRAARITDLGHAIDIAENSRILTPAQANTARKKYLNEMLMETASNPATATSVLGKPLTPEVNEKQIKVGAATGSDSGKVEGAQLTPSGQKQEPAAPDIDSGLASLRKDLPPALQDKVAIQKTGDQRQIVFGSDEAKKWVSDNAEKYGLQAKIDGDTANISAAEKAASALSKSQVEAIANVSTPIETRSKDPLKGVANISWDTNGSRSYGNFGLNSRSSSSSAFQFEKVYGAALGLTEKPGTAAFDEQWRAAAEKDPQALRDAELDWYQKNVLSRVTDDLKKVGVSDTVASDPRVVAYFADRVVQQGPGSIVSEKHSARIGDAWNNSGGDPVSFIKSMSNLDGTRAALYSDFPSALRSGVYSAAGNNHRIAGREDGALSLGVGPAQSSPTSSDNIKLPPWLDSLSPLQKQQWIDAARNTVQKDNTEQVARLTQQVKDDTERLRDTGTAPTGPDGRTAIDQAKAIMKPADFERLNFEWQKARIEHDAISPLANMTPDEARDHLDKFAPANNADSDYYRSMKDISVKAQKRLGDIQALRDKDPALAMDASSEVQQFRQSVRNPPPVMQFDGSLVPGQPMTPIQAMDGLAESRLAAQQRLGIQPDAQRILTKDEGKRLLALGNDPKDMPMQEFMSHMNSAMDRAEKIYGPTYAQRAFTEAVGYMTLSKNERQFASNVAAQIMFKGTVEPSDLRALRDAHEIDPLARVATTLNSRPDTTVVPSVAVNELPRPNQAQIDWLRQNPDGWQAFDQKFRQPGLAAKVLGFSTPGNSRPSAAPAAPAPGLLERLFGSTTPAQKPMPAEFQGARVAQTQPGALPGSMNASLE